jgi:hypothetical protein
MRELAPFYDGYLYSSSNVLLQIVTQLTTCKGTYLLQTQTSFAIPSSQLLQLYFAHRSLISGAVPQLVTNRTSAWLLHIPLFLPLEYLPLPSSKNLPLIYWTATSFTVLDRFTGAASLRGPQTSQRGTRFPLVGFLICGAPRTMQRRLSNFARLFAPQLRLPLQHSPFRPPPRGIRCLKWQFLHFLSQPACYSVSAGPWTSTHSADKWLKRQHHVNRQTGASDYLNQEWHHGHRSTGLRLGYFLR